VTFSQEGVVKNHPAEESFMDKRPRKKRKSERVLLAFPAHYSVEPVKSKHSDNQFFAATVRDFSEEGICLFTHFPMNKGDRITVSCDHIWPEGRRGTIAWCTAMDVRTYKVGIILDEIPERLGTVTGAIAGKNKTGE
jgi:hypothetical protein